MIKAIIFDCFGVVVTDGLEATMAELKTSPKDKQSVLQLAREVDRGAIDKDTFISSVADVLSVAPTEYVKMISRNEIRNQLTMDFIKEIRQTYKTGMLSNVSSLESLFSRFDENELAEYFDVVVASSSIGFIKPEAQAYVMTATKLCVKLRECIMIDDKIDNCQGAVEAGMRAVLYRTFEQLKTDLSALIKQDV